MKTDPKDLREGDRVRITLEGGVTSTFTSGSVSIRPEGGNRAWPHTFTAEILSHAEITRLDPPIQVGDRVKDGDLLATVKGIDGNAAWLLYDGGDRGTELLSVLTRISENPQ